MLRLRSTTIAFLTASVISCGCCHWHPFGWRHREGCQPASSECCGTAVVPDCCTTPAFTEAGPIIPAPNMIPAPNGNCLPPTTLAPQPMVPNLNPTPRLVPQPQSQTMPYTPGT